MKFPAIRKTIWHCSRLTALSLPLFSLLGWADPAANEVPNIPESTERQILGHMKETSQQRWQGWPGIIFYCSMDSEASAAIKQICSESYVNLEALAVAHGVKFHKARTANDVALLPHLTGRLKLVIDIQSTDSGVHPAAMAGRVAVLAHYAHAVNRSAELNSGDSSQPKHPLSVPQHVDGILWEASVIKAATNEEDLVRPVSDGIKEKLKAFFDEYARANP